MSNDYYHDRRIAEAYDAENGPGREITRDDIPFYAGLAREAAARGERVLELGCGTGRVTLPMALSGADITGLDSSPEMLRLAREKADAAGATVTWVQADMASFDLGTGFGLVVIPFRSFLLLMTSEAQRSCLDCLRRHLEQGGRLALNIFNPDILSLVVNGRVGGDRSPLTVERGDGGAVIGRSDGGLRVRWVFRHEMDYLLKLSGFEVEALYGWFDGRPFGDESGEMVWLARRA